MNKLTAREHDVALLVATGLPNKGVADRLGLQTGTIKIHLHNIFRKLGVENRTTLAIVVVNHWGRPA